MNRDPDAEYRAGHIPGAVRFDIDSVKDRSNPLPHMLPSPEAFAAEVGELGIGDGTTIVVYDGAGLFAAPRVWWTFKTFGARDVVILEGGFPAWVKEGRPVEKGVPEKRARKTFSPRFDETGVASIEDIRRNLRSDMYQVVDARPADRFRGEAPEPRPGISSGHIPGSLNVPFTEIVEDGRLRSPDALKAAVERAGVDPDRPVVTTCGSGVSAAILALAMETIGKPVQAIYDGSWAEWASQPDPAIETGPAQPAGKKDG
jgi:thiosulfate/3-mercaptopyruvate sulfurtransferase